MPYDSRLVPTTPFVTPREAGCGAMHLYHLINCCDGYRMWVDISRHASRRLISSRRQPCQFSWLQKNFCRDRLMISKMAASCLLTFVYLPAPHCQSSWRDDFLHHRLAMLLSFACFVAEQLCFVRGSNNGGFFWHGDNVFQVGPQVTELNHRMINQDCLSATRAIAASGVANKHASALPIISEVDMSALASSPTIKSKCSSQCFIDGNIW